MTTKDNPPESQEELELKISKLLVERLEKFMADPDIVAFAGELTIDIESLLDLQKQQLLDAVEKKVIFADGNREYYAKAGDLAGTASAASMNGLRERQHAALNKLRQRLPATQDQGEES